MTSAGEPGFTVGLINYPRFPATNEEIIHHAITIADLLMRMYRQRRVSIVFPERTVTLEAE